MRRSCLTSIQAGCLLNLVSFDLAQLKQKNTLRGAQRAPRWPPSSTAPKPSLRGVSWLTCAAKAACLLARAAFETAWACMRSQGTRASLGRAQCHIQIGASHNAHPVVALTRAAARPQAAWSGWPSKRQGLTMTSAGRNMAVTRRTTSASWCATSPSGKCSDVR